VLLAGTFDDPSAFTPGMELFLSSAQPWLQAPSERQRFDKIAGLIDGQRAAFERTSESASMRPPNMPAQCACCTRGSLLLWLWRAQGNSIRGRINPETMMRRPSAHAQERRQ